MKTLPFIVSIFLLLSMDLYCLGQTFQSDSLRYASVIDSINQHILKDTDCHACTALLDQLSTPEVANRHTATVSMAYRRVINCVLDKHESIDAMPVIERLGKLSRESNNDELKAWHLTLHAELLFNANVKDSVLPMLHRAIKLFEKRGTTLDGLSIACEFLGGIYWDIQDTTKSIYYHKRSLKYAEGNKWLRHIMLANIALYYTRTKNYGEARKYTEMALEEGRKHDRGLGVSYTNLLKIDHSSGASAEVLDSDFNNAVSEAHKWQDQNAMIYAQVSYTGILLKLGDFKKAERILNDTQKTLDDCNECQGYDVTHFYNGYKLYDTLRKPTMALQFLERFVDADRKWDELQTKRNVLLAHATHEFDKRQEEMRLKQEQEMAFAAEKLNAQRRQKSFFIGASALFALMSLLILRNLWKERKAKRLISEQKLMIEVEHERSENLLLNILPAEVAEELKTKGEADARSIDEVTVIFTDFKGFTAMSELLSAKELVKDIHECFSAFDEIMERHGIEKIKTIGDAYMAAGGVPAANTTHAVDVVSAALEMRDFIEAGKARKMALDKPFFEIRIGIHTGPVVAGIVGIKKFQYDIWGDTVNTASRMESSGEAGRINISHTTYELVKDHFRTEYRGEVEAKGKGRVRMYFVERGSGQEGLS
jgi:class 3 adenylate cyclase